MIIIAGTITCDPEKMEDAVEAICSLMEATQAEEGCIDYVLSADPLTPGVIRIFEKWESHLARACLRRVHSCSRLRSRIARDLIVGIAIMRIM